MANNQKYFVVLKISVNRWTVILKSVLKEIIIKKYSKIYVNIEEVKDSLIYCEFNKVADFVT